MKITILPALLLLLQTSLAQTNSWKGTTSTYWGSPTNWSLNLVPTTAHDVVIGDASFTGSFQPSLSSTSYCKSLTIGGSKASTLSSSSRSITVSGSIVIAANGTLVHGSSSSSGGTITLSGNFTNNGTYTTTYTKGRVTFNGVTQSIGGSTATTFRRITVNSSSTVTLLNNITVSSSSSPSITVSGTLNPSTYLISGTNGLTLNSGSKLLVYASTFAGNYGFTGTYSISGGSTVEYASSSIAQTISSSYSYSNLTVSGSSTKSLIANLPSLNSSYLAYGNITINSGTLDVGSYTASRGTSVAGGTLTVANGATLKIGGTNGFPSNYSTKTLGTTSTVEYYGNAQTITSLSYGHLTLSGTSGAVTKTLPGSTLSVLGNFTSTVGAATSVSYTAAAAINVSGNVSIGANTSFSASSFSHNFSSNVTVEGTLSGGTSTITLLGAAGNLSGAGTINFNNLTVGGEGYTAAGASTIAVSGNLATTGSGTFTHNAAGTLSMSGTSKTIAGIGIQLCNLTTTGTISTSADISLTGNLTTSSNSFTASAGVISFIGASKTISGAGTISLFGVTVSGTISTAISFSISSTLHVSGTFTASAGTITFAGVSALAGTASLYNATVNGTSFTLGANSELDIANILSLTAGSFNTGTNIPNTVKFNGSGAQNIPSASYYILETATGGTKTAAGALTITGDFIIGASTSFDASSYSHSITRFFYNNGTFNANTSTFTFDGYQVTHILGAVTFNNLVVNKASAIYYVQLTNSNASATNVTVTTGRIETTTFTLTITGTRNGTGVIYGTIKHQHSFSTATDYAFESPYNTINFTSVAGVTDATVKVSLIPVGDFAGGGAINREYELSINGGTYTGILKLHYEDAELNGNNEAALNLYQNAGAWVATTNTGIDATNNYVQFSPISSMGGRWTLAGLNKIVLWNGNVSADWTNPSNWTAVTGAPTIPPTGEEIVEIGNNNHSYEPTISSAITVRSLQFNNTHASTLTIGTGGSLTLNGNINGTWSGNAAHTINVGAQTLTVNGQIYMSDLTTDHNININVNSGIVNVSGDLYMSGNSVFNCTGTSNLNIGGNFFEGGTFWPGGSGTVTYNGSGYQTVAGIIYRNLNFNKSGGLAESEGNADIYGNMDIQGSSVVDIDNVWQIAGNLSIASGAKMYIDHNVVHIYLSGNLNNSGFMSTDGSIFTLNGNKNQSISAAPLNIFDINKSGGTATLTGNLDLKGDIDIVAGTFDLSTYTANRNSVGGSFQIGDGASLLIGGANNYPANFKIYTAHAGSNTHYNGTVAQTIAASNYGNLLLSNGGSNAKTIGGDCIVSGDLTINNGATLDGNAFNISLLGNWTNNGAFNSSTSTIGFDGTNKLINGVSSFYNAHISGSYAVNDINSSYTNFLEVFASGSFNLGSATTTISGNLTNSGSLSGSGTVIFSGTSLQSIQAINATSFNLTGTVNFNGTIAPVFNSNGSPHFNIVNINNTSASGINPSMGWIVDGAFTVANGATYNGGGYTQSFAGNFTANGHVTSSGTLLFNPTSTVAIALGSSKVNSTGIINLGGTGSISLTGSFANLNDLTISNTLGITPPAALTVNGDFLIANAGIFNAGSYTHIVAGNFDNHNILNAETSTFSFTGSYVTVASGNSSFNNVSTSGIIIPDGNLNINGNYSKTAGTLFNDPTAALVFTGSGSSSFSSNNPPFFFANISIEKTTPTSTTTLNVNFDSLNLIQVLSGTLNIGSYTLTQEPAFGATLIVDSAATMQIGGTNGMPSGITYFNLDSASTIEFAGAAQPINNAITYGGIKISGSGTKTPSGALTMLGTYTQTTAGTTFAAGAYTHLVGGNWNMTAGTFTNTGSTIQFNGLGDQLIGSTGAFTNFAINKSSGTTSLNGNVQIDGSTTLTAGTFNLADKVLSLNGTALAGTSTNLISTSSSGLSFGGSSNSVFIPASIADLGTLTINNSNGVAMNTSLHVASALTLSSGALNIGNNHVLTLSGNHSRTSGTISGSATASLVVDGAGATFNDLSFTSGSNNLSRFHAGRNVGIANTPGVNIYSDVAFTASNVTISTNTSGSNIGLTFKSSIDSTARFADITNAGANSGNAINGMVRIERFIPAHRAWRLLSAPISTTNAPTIHNAWQEGAINAADNPNTGYGTHITGTTAPSNGFDVNPMLSSSLKEYIGGNWVATTNTDVSKITDQPAYMLFVRGSRANNLSQGIYAATDNTTLRIIGNVKTGNQPSNVPVSGFSMVDNPYVSALNLHSIALANSTVIKDNFKIWDPKTGGDYNVGGFITATWNGSDYTMVPPSTSSLSGYLQSGAGFFVESNGGGTLTIAESNKAALGSDNVYGAQGVNEQLFINLRGVNGEPTPPIIDGALAMYNDFNSNLIDQYDAGKLPNPGTENISMTRLGMDLTVERRTIIASTDTIFLKLANTRIRDYQLDLTAVLMNHPNLYGFLEDNYTSTSTPLNLDGNTIYPFSVNSDPLSADTTRFKIVFGPATPLPVTITSIKAVEIANNIQVEWKVENQVNMLRYEIEKSTDGRTFSKAGTQAATGANGSNATYNWQDLHPASGDHFYRIRSISLNGDASYSIIVKVKIGSGKPYISIYPNPVIEHKMNIQLFNMEKGLYTVQLVNYSGQIVMKQNIEISNSNTSQTLNIGKQVANGNYQLVVLHPDGNKTVQKMLVAN
ncbi:MAG: T9SS type A sorting domain-containing protein [Chitinophagaceae bacterium]